MTMDTKSQMSSSEPWLNPPPAPDLDEVRYRVPPPSFSPAWLRAWWPALLWSALIFFASTDTFSSSHTVLVIKPVLRWFIPFISDDRIDAIHFFIRKSAHFSEYFVFYLLLYRAIRGGRKGWRWSWGVAAWFIAAAYSVLDEFHQSFVASRTASPWDSLLDSTGALVALFVLFLFYLRFFRSPAPHST
jgi:VanZ family protein